MKPYRFSPIQSKEELLKAIEYVHFACHKLSKQTFGEYLPVAGDIAIFCHYEDEFDRLVNMRNELADVSDSWNQKYYHLFKPIVVPAKDGVPAATYTHLYIRRADPNRAEVGDADFVMSPAKYKPLKQSLLDGTKMQGLQVFDRPGLDLIQLYDPDVDVLSYVGTHTMEDSMNKPRIIIVNDQDEVIGHKERGTIQQEDIYRVSGLWVTNSKGDILLAQRQLGKRHDPGKWGPAVAGTVDEGETYDSNIIKEAEEEVGLADIKPVKSKKRRYSGEHNYFSQWYTLVVDKPAEAFTIQEEEVQQVKWFSRDELAKELRDNPDNYLKGLNWSFEEL